MKLHIGGTEPKEGWSIFNIQPGENVDFVGNVTDLSTFGNDSIEVVYASHVLEHLGYQKELPTALREIHRVLHLGGHLFLSVPDLSELCWQFLRGDSQRRFELMRIMFGGQTDDYDFHKVGLTSDILYSYLQDAGFDSAVRLDKLGIFADCSEMPISLNMRATK